LVCVCVCVCVYVWKWATRTEHAPYFPQGRTRTATLQRSREPTREPRSKTGGDGRRGTKRKRMWARREQASKKEKEKKNSNNNLHNERKIHLHGRESQRCGEWFDWMHLDRQVNARISSEDASLCSRPLWPLPRVEDILDLRS
jgi:hypothetical protein